MILSTLQPQNPVVLGFGTGCEDSSPVCWYGVVLLGGDTDIAEVTETLHRKGYVASYHPETLVVVLGDCNLRFEGAERETAIYFERVALSNCDLSLGDLTEKFGQLQYVSSECVDLYVSYQIGMTVDLGPASDGRWLLVSPYDQVETIFGFVAAGMDEPNRWWGFLPLQRYEQRGFSLGGCFAGG